MFLIAALALNLFQLIFCQIYYVIYTVLISNDLVDLLSIQLLILVSIYNQSIVKSECGRYLKDDTEVSYNKGNMKA